MKLSLRSKTTFTHLHEYLYIPKDRAVEQPHSADEKTCGSTESEQSLPDHQDRSSCRVHSISTEKGQLASSPSCSTRGYEPRASDPFSYCQSAPCWPETGSNWQQWHTAPCRDLRPTDSQCYLSSPK